jgi:hypothetical protein
MLDIRRKGMDGGVAGGYTSFQHPIRFNLISIALSESSTKEIRVHYHIEDMTNGA